MTASKPVVHIVRFLPSATDAATLGILAGGSTDAERWPHHEYPDDGSNEHHTDILCYLDDDYAGNGIDWKVWTHSPNTSAGNFKIDVGIRRIDVADLSASHTYVYSSSTVADSTTANAPTKHSVATEDGANMDTWAAGELGLVRLTRDTADAADTVGNVMRVLAVVGIEQAA